MLTTTVTHYAPHDHSDDFAVCGARIDDTHVNLGDPTCPRCAAWLAHERALDQMIEDTPLPLDADEAATELDPVLNAGLPVAAPVRQPYFEYAVALTRAAVRRAR